MKCITSKGCSIYPGHLWYHSFIAHIDLKIKFWRGKNWKKQYLYLAGIDMVFEPYLYLRGKDMVFWIFCQQVCICMKSFTSNDCTINHGYLKYHPFRDYMDLNMKFWWRKNWEKPYLYLAGIDMVFRTTSIPRRYRYGFLDILSIRVHLYEVHHIKRLHYKPWLPIISSIQILYGFEHEILMKKKLRKTISIHGWNRYGFWTISIPRR